MKNLLQRVDKISKNKKLSKNNISNILELAEILSDDEKEMMLTLLEDFIIIKQPKYEFHIKEALQQIDSEYIKKFNKIYVLPLISPEDRGKSKSSTYVSYMFQDNELFDDTPLENKKIIVCDTLESLPNKINVQTESTILLVDDYIGTGETALGCLSEFEKFKINLNKIHILSIAIMSEGLEKINEKNIKVYTSIVQDKGISKIENKDIKEKYNSLMQNIETKYNIDNVYNFGYGRSEALIKLVRTPNNTFPLFWNPKIPVNIFKRL